MLLFEMASGLWEALCMMKSNMTVILWSMVSAETMGSLGIRVGSLTKRGWLQEEGGTRWDAGVAFHLHLYWLKTFDFRNLSMTFLWTIIPSIIFFSTSIMKVLLLYLSTTVCSIVGFFPFVYNLNLIRHSQAVWKMFFSFFPLWEFP